MRHFRIVNTDGFRPLYDFEAESKEEAIKKADLYFDNNSKYIDKTDCSLWEDKNPTIENKTWHNIVYWSDANFDDYEEGPDYCREIQSQFCKLDLHLRQAQKIADEIDDINFDYNSNFEEEMEKLNELLDEIHLMQELAVEINKNYQQLQNQVMMEKAINSDN